MLLYLFYFTKTTIVRNPHCYPYKFALNQTLAAGRVQVTAGCGLYQRRREPPAGIARRI
jgi:hypothetical protein